MPLQVLQRPIWDGKPIYLSDTFRLKKGDRTATCELWTHEFGWELRLKTGVAGELPRTQVCRSEEEVLSTTEQWKAAMVERGWR